MKTAQNPMCYVFPRIVSCDYRRFGTGGKEENLNAICILSLNIINDKVFLGMYNSNGIKSKKQAYKKYTNYQY